MNIKLDKDLIEKNFDKNKVLIEWVITEDVLEIKMFFI